MTPTEPSTLEMAIAALALVLGLRFLSPKALRHWAAFAAYAVAVAAGWAARAGWLAPGPAEPATWIRLTGAVLLVAGFLVAGAAARARRDAQPTAIVRTGPYARIRHPLEVGLVLASFGHALRMPGAWAAGTTALSAAVLGMVAVLDEREVARRCGDAWKAYARSTPAVLPRIR